MSTLRGVLGAPIALILLSQHQGGASMRLAGFLQAHCFHILFLVLVLGSQPLCIFVHTYVWHCHRVGTIPSWGPLDTSRNKIFKHFCCVLVICHYLENWVFFFFSTEQGNKAVFHTSTVALQLPPQLPVNSHLTLQMGDRDPNSGRTYILFTLCQSSLLLLTFLRVLECQQLSLIPSA